MLFGPLRENNTRRVSALERQFAGVNGASTERVNQGNGPMEEQHCPALHQDDRHRHGAADPKAARGTSALHNTMRYVRTRHVGTHLTLMHVLIQLLRPAADCLEQHGNLL